MSLTALGGGVLAAIISLGILSLTTIFSLVLGHGSLSLLSKLATFGDILLLETI